MPPFPRYKLIRLHIESLGRSTHTPVCDELQFIALLEREDGTTIERTETLLAYPRLMSDPEQFPPLIAGMLRSMMLPDRS